MSVENDEVVVGVHESGIILHEGANTSLARNYCSNCKRKIHCYVKVDRETKEAKIHKTCKNDDCECKCKTHYACKICGYLHPYTEECNNIPEEPVRDPKTQEAFEKLMSEWKDSKSKKQND